MTRRKRFEVLVESARREPSPPVDVREAVMHQVALADDAAVIRSQRQALIAAAGFSLIAAGVALSLAFPWIEDLYDPMVQLLQAGEGLVP